MFHSTTGSGVDVFLGPGHVKLQMRLNSSFLLRFFNSAVCLMGIWNIILCARTTGRELETKIYGWDAPGEGLDLGSALGWERGLTRVLTVVPGHGDMERLISLAHTLNALRVACDTGDVGHHCLVFVYKSEHLAPTRSVLDFCQVEFSSGLWTNHMIKVPRPARFQKPPTHYHIMMDDINATTVDLPALISTMEAVNYQVASPSFDRWQTKSLLKREGCLAHRTGHVDILFTVMTPDAWDCWKSHLNVALNQYGWGYDLTFADVCRVTIGVVDHEIAYHDPRNCPHGGDCRNRSYDSDIARKQMDQYLVKADVGVPTVEAADRYFKHVAFERPDRFPFCDKVQLHLASSHFYETVTHRGGWKTIIKELINLRKITQDDLDYDSMAYVELVDSIEEWFLWSKRGQIKKDWIGVTHMMTRGLLPGHQAEDRGMVLDTYLDLPEFAASAETCAALVFFTRESQDSASNLLQLKGFNHIETCLVHHPIAVENNAKPFDLTEDLPFVLSKNSSVILLGQQYRRIASLHKLKTNRTKIWLPNRMDEEYIIKHTKKELSIERVRLDPHVEVKRLESNSDFDTTVKRNIIFIDMWAAGANNAILEAIALEAPFFVRRLPGPEEYLGKGYPLFFSSIADVEVLIGDNKALGNAFVEAHIYLKALDRSALGIERFGDDLEECARKAMNNV